MSEISQQFADYALDHDRFGAASIMAAKTFILDSLGVGIAGARAPYNMAVFETAMRWGQGDQAHLWGRALKAPVASAAYINGFQIHAMEFDCVHEGAVVHPMATILAALSAEAQSMGKVSGQDFLEAVIIAVDIAVELGIAVSSPLKFFRPATAGLFGATLGIARLRGFDRDTAMSAMGCALAQCAGVMQAHIEGKPTLPVQIAGAARAAIIACDLAQAGLAGPQSALEGAYGYFAMFEDQADAQAAAMRLGHIHRITEVSWKPFPTGRAAQGGLGLIQKLRAQNVTLGDIKQLTLLAPPIISRLVGRPMIEAMDPNYARLCFAYLAQIALLRGTITLNDFSKRDLGNPDFLQRAKSITIGVNAVTDPAAFIPQQLRAELNSGQIIELEIDKLFGAPDAPLSPEQHLQKFRDCVDFGFNPDGLSQVNAEQAATRLIRAVNELERSANCTDIFAIASGL